MSKINKKIIKFINYDLTNLYIRNFFKIQIKKKIIKEGIYINKEYRNDIIKYWNNLGVKFNVDWHKWYYSKNKIRDVRYIPGDIYYSVVEPYYNRSDFKEAYSDKSFHNIWFANVKRPVTLIKNINGSYYDDKLNLLNFDDAIRCCLNNKIIIKTSLDSGGGRDISFIDLTNENGSKEKLIKILSEFKENYIVQEIIEQHNDLKCINPESVNTIRCISFFIDGEVHVLSSVLRVGINGSKVDNQNAGGLSCGINEDGRLKKYAFDKHGNRFEKHPQGFVFEDKNIPSFNKVIGIIKEEHIKFAHFRIISWDFAIDKYGDPIFIEYNLRFQGINSHQLNNGSLFGDLTDKVIREVLDKPLGDKDEK